MLVEELLPGAAAPVVGCRVAPSIEDVAATTGIAAGVPGRLLGCRTVVDDPELTEFPRRYDDLIEIGIVVDAVEVSPIGGHPAGPLPTWHIVQVCQLGMGGDPVRASPVRLRCVVLLNEMVPQVPFPDNLPARSCCVIGLHFDDHVGPDLSIVVGRKARIAPLGERLISREPLPGNHEDIPVGEDLDIMVQSPVVDSIRQAVGFIQLVRPLQVAIPVEQLDAPRSSRRIDRLGGAWQLCRAQQVAVGQQVGGHGLKRAGPCVDLLAVDIDQIGCRRARGSEERVPLVGLRLVHEQSHRLRQEDAIFKLLATQMAAPYGAASIEVAVSHSMGELSNNGLSRAKHEALSVAQEQVNR